MIKHCKPLNFIQIFSSFFPFLPIPICPKTSSMYMIHRSSASRFLFYIFTLLFFLSFAAFLSAAVDPPTEHENGVQFEESIAIDEQPEKEDELQTGGEQIEIMVESFSIRYVSLAEGTDLSGVPTKMLTVDGSLNISIGNPSKSIAIHVLSTPINLVYKDIVVATGEVKYFYQPRNTRKTISVTVEGDKVPLYGAGSSLPFSPNGIRVPSTLEFEIKWIGVSLGRMERKKHVTCPVVIDSTSTKPIQFNKGICTYK